MEAVASYTVHTHTQLRLFAVALALIACAARASPEVLHLNCIPSAQLVDARPSPRFTERVWLRQTSSSPCLVVAVDRRNLVIDVRPETMYSRTLLFLRSEFTVLVVRLHSRPISQLPG